MLHVPIAGASRCSLISRSTRMPRRRRLCAVRSAPVLCPLVVIMQTVASPELFDSVADEYADIRPGYPDELFEFLVRTAGIGMQSTIVEVGCGTGQATLDFAKRGFSVLCLEPGAQLAKRARQELLPYPNVSLEQCRFEEWEPASRRFSLLFSAQAYHWIDPEIAVTKPREVLEPNGIVALIWNVDRRDSSAMRAALDCCYEHHAPQLAAKSRDKRGATRDATVGRFATSPLYSVMAKGTFPWTRRYSARDYVRLLGTYSDHLALSSGARDDLFGAIKSAILEVGGSIELKYDAFCYMFRSMHDA